MTGANLIRSWAFGSEGRDGIDFEQMRVCNIRIIMKDRGHIFTAALLLVITAARLQAQNVEVTVTGIRSEKGQIAVGVFVDDESFRTEKAFLEPRFPKKGMAGGTMTFTLTLEPGVYGLSLLDDENSNGQMEYGMLGIPKEGFGFSDYYHTGFSKPRFNSFAIKVSQGTVTKVTVRMRYL